jgi:hypothetical protein
MFDASRTFERRVDSARLRIADLLSLRQLVGLPIESDISSRQWAALERQLRAAEARLNARLRRTADQYLGKISDIGAARAMNAALGDIELELARTYTFFDTYVDVLTQRYSPRLGPLLAGCDVLAWHAMRKDHPALRIVEPPLVFCDRGFGASIIRESVKMPDGTPNPIPLIQIPYSRLKEKCNLTSVLHEVGHQALMRLGLVSAIPKALRATLARAGASSLTRDMFALWSSEIGPDFWTFCTSGMAAAAGLREILALPPSHVFRVSWTDPHPPPYLRVLLSFEWCRQQWGRGDWDAWQREWTALYPIEAAAREVRKILVEGLAHLPAVARTLFATRFRTLAGRRLPDLFRLSDLSPPALEAVTAGIETGTLRLTGVPPTTQLAVFRLIRERTKVPEDELDGIMTRWLTRLGARHALAPAAS